MCQAILRTILTSLDSPFSASLTYDDVCTWPEGTLAVLEDAGVLKRGGNALTITCDGCDLGCVEDVAFSGDSDGSLVGYIVCREREDVGRVRVAPERLRTWEVSFAGLAALFSRELAVRSEELIPGRMWILGSVETADARTDIFLARGLRWSDGDQILREARSRQQNQPAVLLVPTAAALTDSFEVVPLMNVLSLEGNGLSVDISAIREAAERSQKASSRILGADKHLFREGVDTWAIAYDGVAVSPPLKNAKGLHYLAFLLARPGQEFSALQIVHEVDGTPYDRDETHAAMSAEELEEYGLSVSGFTDAGEIMDDQYEADVRRRMNELEQSRDLSEAMGDRQATSRAESELEQYRRALGEGIGLSGKHRSSGNASEKARVAVTQAIGRVLKKLKEQHFALHDHLFASLQTGTKCVYNPTTPIGWKF